LRLAFLGDINGSPGRSVVAQQLPRMRAELAPDAIVANGENARAGSGITPDLLKTFLDFGIDAVTLGDHCFREGKILPSLCDASVPIARPANLSRKAPGKRLLRIPAGGRRTRDLWVFTVLGRIYFPLPADDPFACADEMLAAIPEKNPVVLVEAHMEATSEKAALGKYLDGRVAAVIGTHTHVPTADARVFRGGTAFLTDAGMCGPYDSVIGRNPDQVLKHMTTAIHVPYEMGSGGEAMCGALVEIDEARGLAISIRPFRYDADYSEPPFRGMR
jgi:metallophosphoesterase (TIGR00282 family)